MAIADYNAALRLDRDLPSALYGRGLARLKTSNQAAGKADIAAAKRGDQQIAEQFARYGLQ
ncbi:MAG: tetratricopeptide repeat protein [Xanthobacteraceae bacterium]